jgi:hypothetical protein
MRRAACLVHLFGPEGIEELAANAFSRSGSGITCHHRAGRLGTSLKCMSVPAWRPRRSLKATVSCRRW